MAAALAAARAHNHPALGPRLLATVGLKHKVPLQQKTML